MIITRLFNQWRETFITTKLRPITIYISIQEWCDLLDDKDAQGKALHDWIDLEFATIRYDATLNPGELRYQYAEPDSLAQKEAEGSFAYYKQETK